MSWYWQEFRFLQFPLTYFNHHTVGPPSYLLCIAGNSMHAMHGMRYAVSGGSLARYM